MLVILYERAGKILPNAHLNILWGVWSIDLEATDDPNQPRCKNSWSKHKSYVLLCFLLFLISLLVSVCNLTETHGARSCRLHGDWKCLNLPSHFLFFFFFTSLLQQIEAGASATNKGFLPISEPRRRLPLCLPARLSWADDRLLSLCLCAGKLLCFVNSLPLFQPRQQR